VDYVVRDRNTVCVDYVARGGLSEGPLPSLCIGSLVLGTFVCSIIVVFEEMHIVIWTRWRCLLLWRCERFRLGAGS